MKIQSDGIGYACQKLFYLSAAVAVAAAASTVSLYSVSVKVLIRFF